MYCVYLGVSLLEPDDDYYYDLLESVGFNPRSVCNEGSKLRILLSNISRSLPRWSDRKLLAPCGLWPLAPRAFLRCILNQK